MQILYTFYISYMGRIAGAEFTKAWNGPEWVNFVEKLSFISSPLP